MKHFQNSIKMKKNIKAVCIFYHIKSISEPGVTAVQLNTAKHEFNLSSMTPGHLVLRHLQYNYIIISFNCRGSQKYL